MCFPTAAPTYSSGRSLYQRRERAVLDVKPLEEPNGGDNATRTKPEGSPPGTIARM